MAGLRLKLQLTWLGPWFDQYFLPRDVFEKKIGNALFMLKGNGERIPCGLSNQSKVFHFKWL
jgi:hypothetical protein